METPVLVYHLFLGVSKKRLFYYKCTYHYYKVYYFLSLPDLRYENKKIMVIGKKEREGEVREGRMEGRLTQ